MRKIEEALTRLAQVTSSNYDQDLILDAVKEMKELKANLKSIEWVGHYNTAGNWYECPACHGDKFGGGHADSCWLARSARGVKE